MKVVTTLFRNTQTSFLTLFLILFSLGQLQRIQLPNDRALYAHDILIGVFLICSTFQNNLFRNRNKIAATVRKTLSVFRLETMWVTWLVGGMVLGIFSGHITTQSALYLFRLIVYCLFIFTIGRSVLGYSPRQGITAAGLLIGAWGLLQYVLLPDTRFLFLYGWDNHYYRFISTLFDPAFTGAILVLVMGFLHTPHLYPLLPKLGRWVIEILLLFGIAATFSRASYIALACLLGIFIMYKRITLHRTVMLALLFCFFIWLLPKPGGEGVNLGRTSTIHARISNTQQNLVSLTGWQWLWGRGVFNTDNQQDYQTPNHAQLPDNVFILVLNASGVGGTLLTAGVLYKWLMRWRQNDPIWTGVFLSLLLHSVFNNTLLQPFVFLALGLGKIHGKREQKITGGSAR